MNILGAVFAALAGAAMSVQGVMNTRLSDKIGLFESNAFVQATAFALSLIVMLVFGRGDLFSVFQVKPVYLFGGVLGIAITVFVMLAMSNLSPAVAVSVILIAQLLVAAIIDAFGIMESPKIPFHWTKFLGLFLMIAGVIVFKIKGSN